MEMLEQRLVNISDLPTVDVPLDQLADWILRQRQAVRIPVKWIVESGKPAKPVEWKNILWRKALGL